MEINTLDWDTECFEYKVGKVALTDNLIDKNLLLNNDYRLIYLYSKIPLSEELIKNLNLFLADEKVELSIQVSDLTINKLPNENLVEVTELDDDLLNLTYQSGHFSRFKIDTNFKNNEFEKLYAAWIEQSVTHKSAEKVIGYLVNNNLVGFVTIGFKNNAYDIGLIAVDEAFRNFKIGKQLLNYVLDYAILKKINKVTVTTQNQNQGAMKFYLNNGFLIDKTTYIYHLWK